MSSMYNMVVGYDPLMPHIMRYLDITTQEKLDKSIPRFRDAYFDGKDHLVIFTRTGGGNREVYESGDESPNNDSVRHLEKLEFVDDHDDSFDSTFAHFRFKVPEELKEIVQAGKDQDYDFPAPMDRFRKVLGGITSK